MVYTNADQFINKRDDLCCLIAGDEPDLIMITEVIPKAQRHPIALALLDIPGYQLYLSFDPNCPNLGTSRTLGVGVFVASRLHAAEVVFEQCPFQEQLWVKLTLSGTDRLLVGCVYRSPSGDDRPSMDGRIPGDLCP